MTRKTVIVVSVIFSLFSLFGCSNNVAGVDREALWSDDGTDTPDQPIVGDGLGVGEDDALLADDADTVATHTELRMDWELIREAAPVDDTTLFPARARAAVVSFDGALWLFGGVDRHDVWRSVDGTQWNEVADAITPSIVGNRAVAVHAGKFWTVTAEGVWNSADGKDWTLLTASPAFCQRSDFSLISWQDALWLIGGRVTCAEERGDVWRSTDGVVWEGKAQFSEATGLPDGSCKMYGDGIAGTTPLALGDTMLLFGGHHRGACTHEGSSTPPVVIGCVQNTYRYELEVVSITADGAVATAPVIPAGWPSVSDSAIFRHNDKYWFFGGAKYVDDMFQQIPYPGGMTEYECTEVPPEAQNTIYSSPDGFNWSWHPSIMPPSVIEGPAMVEHDGAIWIIGATGINEIWRGMEREVTVVDPIDDCSRGSYTGDNVIVAATVADLEALRGYTDLPTLEITAEVPDLSMLHCLTSIATLIIKNTDSMLSLNGLEQLTTIDADVLIEANGGLTDMTALSHLQKIGGAILIRNNRQLKGIHFPELNSFDGRLEILFNDALTTITGFPNIDRARDLQINLFGSPLLQRPEPFTRVIWAQSIGLVDTAATVTFPALGAVDELGCTEISGAGPEIFPVLTDVGNVLRIQYSSLASLTFPLLERVVNVLDISGCDGFSGVPIFPKLSTVDQISVSGSTIEVLSGFPLIESLGTLSITEGQSLISVEAFTSLKTVGLLSLEGNTALSSLAGLNAITRTAWVQIEQNDALTSLGDLSSLVEIGSGFMITNNAAISDVSRLEQLTSFTDATYTSRIQDNPMLATCAAQKVIDHLVNDLGAPVTNFEISGNNDSLTCE